VVHGTEFNAYVSLLLWLIFTWSLGWTGFFEPNSPPKISIARFEMTFQWHPMNLHHKATDGEGGKYLIDIHVSLGTTASLVHNKREVIYEASRYDLVIDH